VCLSTVRSHLNPVDKFATTVTVKPSLKTRHHACQLQFLYSRQSGILVRLWGNRWGHSPQYTDAKTIHFGFERYIDCNRDLMYHVYDSAVNSQTL